ncbi:DNA-binding IclR family transcriptional regulator [Microbacterium sp. AK009]|uniref:IclR family transcriptional regulator n=1 Tax=Microbacterium sp. AK009 TaxID=2723068 RepID=UPI0015CB27C1|nr:IclR family transcriptional regulator [Microbacterium sp. AK009]NYF16815.1 DNA-binding IclR family transcriptional regulator [Microbacterium sp. AK009]
MTQESLQEPSGDGSRSLIDRAFTILGTFYGGRVRQSLSDISRRSGLPIATCHRIVGRLTEWGALERDTDGNYNIGLRLWEVASLAPRSVGLQRLARPYMQDLYETTGYASHLAIREGLELVSIERFQSPRRQVRRPQVGKRYPLHATAIGLVLLANAPDEVRAQVLAGELEAFTPRTFTDPVVLDRLLDDIRHTGYAVSDRQVDDVHIGVAAPVRGADKTVVAAVSLALTEQDVDGKNMIHLVRLTAASISRALDNAGFGRAES